MCVDLFDLNTGTMLIVLILGQLTTGILVVSYSARRKSTAVNVFLLSKLFQLAAWIMVVLRVVTPSMILKIAANGTLFIGVALELTALLILKNSYTKIRKQAYIGLLIVCALVFIAVAASYTGESARIAAASLVGAVLMAFPVYVLFTDGKSSLLQRVVAAFYGVTILFLLCRAYGALSSDITMDLSSSNFFNTGLFLLLYLVMLAGSVGFILMDKEKTDQEMLRAASLDGLTNIYNRRNFVMRSREVIALCIRKREEISCLLIDIDDFKQINDEHGHYAGDAILIHFADILKKSLRSYDVFGRYGGDEFSVLLPETDREESIRIAERLRKAIEDSWAGTDSEIKYTVSIGAATIASDRETNIETLYKLSDDALYAAKMKGKNRVFHAHAHGASEE